MPDNKERNGSVEPRQHTNCTDDQAPKERSDGTTVDQTGNTSLRNRGEMHGDPNRMGTPELSNPDGPRRPTGKTEERKSRWLTLPPARENASVPLRATPGVLSAK
jgi:hypothetical protein